MNRTDAPETSRLSGFAVNCTALYIALFAAGAPGTEIINGGIRDPYFQEALYYQSLSDPLSALARLQVARQQHRLQVDLGAVDLELGRLYSDYNMPQMAADSFARVMGQGTAANLRSEASYRLAQYYYQRGDYARASSALSQTGIGLPYALEAQKPFFKSLILMADGRNAEAVKVFGDWQSPLQYDPYTRYNIGVALMRKGDLLVGAGFLDSVGVMAADNEELLSLRDQANLALGYGFMRADQGATARPLLKRVRLDGSYSNSALLGAGWAELAPDGKKQQNLFLSPIACKEDPAHMLPQIPILHRPGRDACDPDKIFKQRVDFENTPGAKSEAERLRRALTPWMTLIQRSPAADPSVQEAMLAVPYAFNRLKGSDQAIQYYRQAVTAYEQERDALDRLMEVVRTGPINITARLSDKDMSWQTAIWGLPRPEDVRYLQELFAGYQLQAALEDYRDLQDLTQNLAASSTRLVAVAQSIGSSETTATEQSPTPPAPQPTVGQEPQRVIDLGLDNTLLLGALTPPPTETTASAAATGSSSSPSPARLGERYATLQRNLATLRADTQAALAAQEQAVRGLALSQLENHRQRLETYLAQARIALAHLLDPALSQVRP